MLELGTTGQSGGFFGGLGTGGPIGQSSSEGFIGSQGTGSDDYVQAGRSFGESSADGGTVAARSNPNDGADLENQESGALDERDSSPAAAVLLRG